MRQLPGETAGTPVAEEFFQRVLRDDLKGMADDQLGDADEDAEGQISSVSQTVAQLGGVQRLSAAKVNDVGVEGAAGADGELVCEALPGPGLELLLAVGEQGRLGLMNIETIHRVMPPRLRPRKHRTLKRGQVRGRFAELFRRLVAATLERQWEVAFSCAPNWTAPLSG